MKIFPSNKDLVSLIEENKKLLNYIKYGTNDVIITNCYSDFEKLSVLPEQLGDHFSVKCEVQFKVEKPQSLKKISIHDYSSNNIKTFQAYLANIDFIPLFMSYQVDNALSILETYLNVATI